MGSALTGRKQTQPKWGGGEYARIFLISCFHGVRTLVRLVKFNNPNRPGMALQGQPGPGPGGAGGPASSPSVLTAFSLPTNRLVTPDGQVRWSCGKLYSKTQEAGPGPRPRAFSAKFRGSASSVVGRGPAATRGQPF